MTLAGAPLRVVRARIAARVEAQPRDRAREAFEAAARDSTIANSVMAAFPIAFALEETAP